MRILLTGLILSLLAPMSAIADHVTPYFSDSGCGDIVSAKVDSHAFKSYGSYALGFIAGVNYKDDRTVRLDSKDVEQWVWNYCNENPLNSLNDAVMALDIELDEVAGK